MDFARKHYTIKLSRGRSLMLGPRTLIMGVVNVTPDSFSDGGLYVSTQAAVDHALQLVHEGADILDIGGESTRPGAEAVDADAEIRRVVPVIQQLVARTDVPISIDTTKLDVARAALNAGAAILNDITGLHGDPSLADVAAEYGAPVIVMHIKGTPRTMQQNPVYDDLIGDISDYLRRSVEIAVEHGVSASQVIIDPGIGFGKTVGHNLEIMARLHEFAALDQPILVGTSRKSTIGALTGKPVEQRIMGSAATVALCIANGAHIVRVHDVAEMVDVAKVADAVNHYKDYE